MARQTLKIQASIKVKIKNEATREGGLKFL